MLWLSWIVSESCIQGTNASLYFFDGKIQNQYGGPGRDRTYEGEAKGFTVLPIWPLWNRPIMEPPIRLELMTAGLQNRCSTNWAKVACEADCIKNDCLVKIFLYNNRYDFYNSHLRWRETLLWSNQWVSQAIVS